VAEDVVKGVCDRGILVCGTGIGVSIAANKVKGAYAACVSNVYHAQRAILSNNANIITLGALVTGPELAKCLVEAYLSNTSDPASRSAPKVNRICEYERKTF
jgi:ribose 5-phosphate isomerase B